METESIEGGGPPWNPKHEGIPLTWKHIGDGGNAHVWSDGRYAIKRLRPNASDEPVARFKREATLLECISRKPGLAIVPIVEVREREGELEIVMVLLDGNLAQVIGEFAGQPEKAASALVPIVDTLAQLAVWQPQPIHHRDLKPENLLFQRRDGDIAVALSDFGCAYLAEDERLTPTHRAIGAWAYRPPEYCIGRVVAVDEKGDVFSLGKLLWAMVNGQRHVVFPGPIWFEEEFDLSRRFPKGAKMHHTMVLIAQACNIRPEKRPTLAQFAASLRELAKPDAGDRSMKDPELDTSMLRKEALRAIEYEQRKASAAQFVRALHLDFLSAVEQLHRGFPQSALFAQWFTETEARGQTTQALVNQVAELESDAPISNVFFRKTLLVTRFWPMQGATPLHFLARVQDQDERVAPSELRVLDRPEGITVEFKFADGEASSATYGSQTIHDFLRKAAFQVL